MALNERDRYIDHTLQTADKEDLSRSEFFHLLRDTAKSVGDDEFETNLDYLINKVLDSETTRRSFLKLSLAIGAGTLAMDAAELLVEWRRINTLWERRHMPKYVENVVPGSIAFGTAPDGNKYENVNRYDQTIGQQCQLVNIFLTDYYYDKIFDEIYKCVDNGKVVVLSWRNDGPLYKNFTPDNLRRLNYLLDVLVDIDDHLIFSPFYEPNNRAWYGVSADEYVATWRWLHDLCRNQKHMQCPFVFRISSTTIGEPFAKYYPGHEYVDGVAGDWYRYAVSNKGDLRYWNYVNLPARYEMGIDIKVLQEIAGGKSILGGEFNPSVDKDDDIWKDEAIDMFINSGVRAWMGFNWNLKGTKIFEDNWDSSDRPGLVRVIQQQITKPMYVHNGPQILTPKQVRDQIFLPIAA